MDESIQIHLKPELDEASQLLLKVADYIERHGICQSGRASESVRGAEATRGCTIWTLSKLDNHVGAFTEACRRLEAVVPQPPVNPKLCPVASWSDNTPAAEVITTLRAVALGG